MEQRTNKKRPPNHLLEGFCGGAGAAFPKAPCTSDKDQTIKVSVYGGEEQNVSFSKGETKTIVLAR